MAELTTSERLQPSLLDRLTDDHPEVAHESRERRVMSMRQLRAAVLRGSAAAAITVARVGCAPAFPTTAELDAFLRSHPEPMSD